MLLTSEKLLGKKSAICTLLMAIFVNFVFYVLSGIYMFIIDIRKNNFFGSI